jgi:diguanylate cyclase (GGDEF)-like protein
VRGLTDTANAIRTSGLIRNSPARTYAVAGALATAIAAATGALTSPLAALLGLWLFLLAERPFQRLATRLAALAIAALGVFELAGGGMGLLELATAAVLVCSFLVGRLRTDQRASRLRKLETYVDVIRNEIDQPVASTAEARAARTLEALRESLTLAATRTGAERAVLWHADVETRRLTLRMASDGHKSASWLPLAGSPLGWLADEGQPLRFDARPPLAARLANVLALRLSFEHPHATILTLEFGPEVAVPEADAVAPVAREVVHAIDNLQERDAHAEYRARIDIVLATLRRLPESIDLDTFARDLVRDACRLTRADGGALSLWEDDTGHILAVEGAVGGPQAGATFSATDSELALAARAGTTLVQDLAVKRVAAGNIAAPGERWQQKPRHLVAVPLPAEGEIIAIVGTWSRTQPHPESVKLLESLAFFAGSQLARALEFRKVRESAERDALTGLTNRKAFERALARERQRFERYQHPVALLVADVDHFKAVNDTHGHEAGDEVLRALAEALRRALRDVDTVARFGGEEFVMLLPETGLRAASEVAERVRASVEALSVEWRGTRIPVRVSVGVSACPECAADPDELVRSGDAALYQAKGQGRNRVVEAPRRGTSGTGKKSGAVLRRT